VPTCRRGDVTEVIEPGRNQLVELQTFIMQLGAALNATGEPVYSVQERLSNVARAYGADDARISAFPTYLMVTMGRDEPATLELTSVTTSPRLDQVSALDRLMHEAERHSVSPSEGLRRLDELREMGPRFGRWQSMVGYSVLALGLCLILRPAPREVAAAAVLGALVGALRSYGKRQSPVQILMPLIAAFVVSALCALAVKYGVTEPGLRSMVAALVVFLPGTMLTTAVLELAAGQMVAGSSRLVSGVMQLALLAFGIIAGIDAVGVSSSVMLADPSDLLGHWVPWLGVFVFAVGVVVANSAPARSFPGLLIVLYAAWCGQVLGNAILGGYVSAFLGALVMTPVAYWTSRLPSAMPQHASFLPGFWLLVPGALGLIGFAQLAGDANAAGAEDIVATVVSIFAVAVGVLCGTLLLAWATATGKLVNDVSGSVSQQLPWPNRLRARSGPRSPSSGSSGDRPKR
jgi:uncharacterized membrane protein YjjP (DUF1212 family)